MRIEEIFEIVQTTANADTLAKVYDDDLSLMIEDMTKQIRDEAVALDLIELSQFRDYIHNTILTVGMIAVSESLCQGMRHGIIRTTKLNFDESVV